MKAVQRNLALILVLLIVSGCSGPFGATLQTVTFTVLDTAGSGFGIIPQAEIVNSNEQSIDILITGEALRNGGYPLLVSHIKADHNKIYIYLDWDNNEKALNEPVHKLIRIDKGDWWKAGSVPEVHLLNINEGKLHAASKTREVRQAVYELLPELKIDNVYFTFSLENVREANVTGVWEATVTGTVETDDSAQNVVAEYRLDDRNLNILGGKLTYYSANGSIVKVESVD